MHKPKTGLKENYQYVTITNFYAGLQDILSKAGWGEVRG